MVTFSPGSALPQTGTGTSRWRIISGPKILATCTLAVARGGAGESNDETAISRHILFIAFLRFWRRRGPGIRVREWDHASSVGNVAASSPVAFYRMGESRISA